MKLDLEKLKDILVSIIVEQGTCELSGILWTEDKLKELDKAFKGAPMSKEERLAPCPFCNSIPNMRLGGTGNNPDDVYFNVPHKTECFLYQTYGQILNKSQWDKWQTRPQPHKQAKPALNYDDVYEIIYQNCNMQMEINGQKCAREICAKFANPGEGK